MLVHARSQPRLVSTFFFYSSFYSKFSQQMKYMGFGSGHVQTVHCELKDKEKQEPRPVCIFLVFNKRDVVDVQGVKLTGPKRGKGFKRAAAVLPILGLSFAVLGFLSRLPLNMAHMTFLLESCHPDVKPNNPSAFANVGPK